MSNKLPYRLYIESDVLHQEEVDSAAHCVEFIFKDMGIPFHSKVFDEAIGYAWHDLEKTWGYVQKADEIFASSSLYGLSGARTYVGAPPLMDGMMKIAYDKNITGKALYFLTNKEDILWDNISLVLLRRVFAKRNKLFCTSKESGLFVQLNIPELIMKVKNNQ